MYTRKGDDQQASYPVADLEGVQGVHSNSPLWPNYFIFMGSFKVLCEIR